jgi:hypothetical protein
MARRYLTEAEVLSTLSRGASVEQWLESTPVDSDTVLRWLRIDRERDGQFSVTYFEVFDDGGPEFLDIYEFSSVDVDKPHGESTSFDDAKRAIRHCVESHQARTDRFVNAGMIQEEYADYVSTRMP